ncbi:hypothetical protein BRC81_14280 [Halobacteriales archaeon QS_1_68_20]|nr:MAG: hypothetical protein BRC81_14280 [Halobacteriales archaeon QS_1_68_20]
MEYWRTHPGEWPSFSEEVCLLLLEEEGEQLFVHPAKNKQRLVAELEKSPGGDCYLELAHRYLAARVNRRHVRPYPEGHADFWDWVERYNRWVEWADRPQDDWTAGGVDGSAVKRYFERWNEGVGGPCAARSLSGSAFGVDRV